MSSFFDVTEGDLSADEQLIFKDKEIVEFVCKECKENSKLKALILSCDILSGEHKGKIHEIYVRDGDPSKKNFTMSKKRKAQFLKTFWTPDKLLKKEISPADLVGRKFTAMAEKPFESDKGAIFQGFYNYADLGAAEASSEFPGG
jgi:hypothetical protein